MKGSTRSFAKKASNLYQSIHQQLSVYAGAAVVAVVSVLALTQPSEAKIVYTPANVVLTCFPRIHNSCSYIYSLDLDHDGVTDFTIDYTRHTSPPPFCADSRAVYEFPIEGNGVLGKSPAALNEGAQIGHGQSFYGGERVMAFSDVGGFHSCTASHGGPWWNVTGRYLGLSFQRNGRTHYGWARLTVTVQGLVPLLQSATLTGYAYETIAGKSITAGQTNGAPDDPTNEDFGPGASLTNPIPDTPRPATLGALAMGAPGLSIWRRKQEMETAKYGLVVSMN
jgi:hypothetical protein